MSDGAKNFGETAKSLARNPLGIIALFIVLVYGFASLVTAFGTSFTPEQKTPLVYFMIVFPVLVLGVFSWLVSKHSGKLFAPADFKNEDNYVRMQLSAVASLAVASKKSQPDDPLQIERIVNAVQAATRLESSAGSNWRNRVLWVDDHPDNNIYERSSLEAIGLKFSLATSTTEALDLIPTQRFAAIISDMGRREGPREGYVLLDALRSRERFARLALRVQRVESLIETFFGRLAGVNRAAQARGHSVGELSCRTTSGHGDPPEALYGAGSSARRRPTRSSAYRSPPRQLGVVVVKHDPLFNSNSVYVDRGGNPCSFSMLIFLIGRRRSFGQTSILGLASSGDFHDTYLL